MKCFYDSAADAVGTCKSCGRGVSRAYATEFPKGLACKGRCELEVEKLIALIDGNVAMRGATAFLMKGSSSTLYATFALYLMIAIGFIWMGFGEEALRPTFYLGVAFGGFAIYSLVRGLKVSRATRIK